MGVQIRRRKRWVLAGSASLALIGPLVAPGVAGASRSAGPPSEIVFRLNSPSAAIHASSILAGLPISAATTAPGDRYQLQVPAANVAATLAQLRADKQVAYAEVPQRVHASDVTPNDPCFTGCGPITPIVEQDGQPLSFVTANQQDLVAVHAPAAWAVTQGSSAITVAVLDSGVDSGHPDLAGKVIVGPNECAHDDPGCAGNADNLGHGTHVTGTIAAATNNGQGVASLGWNTHVEMFKVLDNTGGGNTADLATAIYDAVASGARIINMSLGNDSCDVAPTNCGIDPDLQSAVNMAISRGVVVVAAAGNDYSNQPTYPADFPGVLSVAATDNNGIIQNFSQYGAAANIAAPGLDVVSTWNDGNYATLTGTSMSSPHVAAAAALVMAVNPSLSGAQISGILQSTARPTSGGDAINGGLLDAGAAVRAATSVRPPAPVGYVLAGAAGQAYAFGGAGFHGDMSGVQLNKPVVAVASRPDLGGYWLAASDGGVFTFGSAGFYGSAGSIPLNRPIVGMAPTPDGGGYWLVASDGGVFTYGDAGFYGSTGGRQLNRPIVGMAPTRDGRGYWLVASDGGVFSFGNAAFHGSTGGIRLNRPVVGMAATPSGGGYWLVATDGGVFTFGDGAFYGSTGGLVLNRPIVAMAATPTGGGYWLTGSDGGIFTFGSAPYDGSTGAQQLPAPIVGIGS
ncbi:MAG: S8 family serine peptidase [Actinomycetota bacterium]|nr:S8 family serine peptidase [Actinomycetota bacterium]